MTTLGIQAGITSVTVSAGAGRSTSQAWAVRKERVKDSQNRQCLFCGRSEARYHTLVHNVGNRETPLVGRIILAWQIIGPRESRFVTSICRLLFRCFLRSAAGSAFHPSALHVRPMAQLPGGGVEIPAEAV